MSLRDDLRSGRGVLAAIAALHGGSNLHLFGSVLRREERADSDEDLLVDVAYDRGFGDYLTLIEELESLLERRLDFATERNLDRHLRPMGNCRS